MFFLFKYNKCGEPKIITDNRGQTITGSLGKTTIVKSIQSPPSVETAVDNQ